MKYTIMSSNRKELECLKNKKTENKIVKMRMEVNFLQIMININKKSKKLEKKSLKFLQKWGDQMLNFKSSLHSFLNPNNNYK